MKHSIVLPIFQFLLHIYAQAFSSGQVRSYVECVDEQKEQIHCYIYTPCPCKMADLDDNANDISSVNETMQAEEERMRAISRKQDEEREARYDKEREADIKGGSKAVDTKFKALEYLLSQSKVRGGPCNS